MEPWTLENSVIRLLAGIHKLAAGLALFLLTIVALIAIVSLGDFLFNPELVTFVGVWTFIWIFCGVTAAAANFVWSLTAFRDPNWRAIGKVTALSLAILVVSPVIWTAWL